MLVLIEKHVELAVRIGEERTVLGDHDVKLLVRGGRSRNAFTKTLLVRLRSAQWTRRVERTVRHELERREESRRVVCERKEDRKEQSERERKREQ